TFGLGVAVGDRDGRAVEIERFRQTRFDVLVVRHARKLRPWFTIVNHSRNASAEAPEGTRAPTLQPQLGPIWPHDTQAPLAPSAPAVAAAVVATERPVVAPASGGRGSRMQLAV